MKLGASEEAGGVRFACFASGSECAVRLLGRDGRELSRHRLEPRGGGYFDALVEAAAVGTLYDFCVDGRCLPDPYARYLPRGVHGPAEVVAQALPPLPLAAPLPQSRQVIYELHVGTFSEAGSFAAAAERLPYLAELGVTCVELMPVAAFAGERGWGYDGVALFAPHAAYGSPGDLREFVAVAHALGLSVLLDVVYNHFGPSGNYLGAYSASYFQSDVHNAWGQAPNFEEPALRNLVLENARYWLTEFGFDGLRLDATHALDDRSARHILLDLAELAHGLTPRRLLIAEDERNLAALVNEFGLDALWADDFHHQVRVSLTRERDGYFAAFTPSVADIARTIDRGWLYEGQPSPVTQLPRGSSASALAAEALVYCLQNHDQVGNRALGDRLACSISPAAYRAVSLLLLFLPMTPLLFMGQEWAARTPFLYFTDHDPELGRQVSEGRRREFAGFSQFRDEQARSRIPDPQAESTFLASRLDWSERNGEEAHRTFSLYRDAIALRQLDSVLGHAGRRELSASAQANVLIVKRWFGQEQRCLLVNFGRRDVALATLDLDLGGSRRLLQTETRDDDVLPAEGAILFAQRR